MSMLALAIQTIPDIETGRRLHNIENLSDLGVAKAMFHLQQQRTGSEELPLYLQQIVSIAIAYKIDGTLQTEVLKSSPSESVLLENYVQASLDKQQITWRGNCYDFPILRYRALKQGIKLVERHDARLQVDLSQQFISASEQSANTSASLADISCLLDLPPLARLSKMDIWQAYLAQDYAVIDNAAQADAANIYRIGIRSGI
jgi:predicted PolB exonuclease-like 3'-5' exonuclease